MLACWFVGFLVGLVAQRTVQQHIDEYKQAHPIPNAESETPERDKHKAGETTS